MVHKRFSKPSVGCVNVPQSIFSLLNDIFVQSPGDFLYFLVVMVLNLISLMMAFRLSRNGESALRRYPLALVGMVFAWSLMFLGAIFIRFSGQAANAILPPLERAVTATSMLLLGWAFLNAGAMFPTICYSCYYL
jgi:hypothetical protein